MELRKHFIFLNTSLVSGNSSDEIGGGIAIFSTSGDSSYINGSTIVENESKSIEGDEPPSGSAIYTDWNIQMHHSIVWDNKTNFYDPTDIFQYSTLENSIVLDNNYSSMVTVHVQYVNIQMKAYI